MKKNAIFTSRKIIVHDTSVFCVISGMATIIISMTIVESGIRINPHRICAGGVNLYFFLKIFLNINIKMQASDFESNSATQFVYSVFSKKFTVSFPVKNTASNSITNPYP